MVNCSKAESNYAANLLIGDNLIQRCALIPGQSTNFGIFFIGQRDKPFVPEDENEIRTPRPDLLDRPYSAGFHMDTLKYNFFKVC